MRRINLQYVVWSFFLSVGLVNAQGKLMITAQFDKVFEYRTNRALVQKNGQYGLLDEDGKIVQAIKYESYSYDKDGNYVLK